MTVCLPRIRRIVPLLGLLVILMGVFSSSAQAATTLTLDPTAGELPEGLAFDHHGDAFFTAAPLGEVLAHARRYPDRDCARRTAGCRFRDDGAGVQSRRPSVRRGYNVRSRDERGVRGVSRRHVDACPRQRTDRVPERARLRTGRDALCDRQREGRSGQLDVGHRSHAGGSTTLLVEDPVLAGDGSFGFGVPIGANGIALRDGALYVSVTETARIVRIPLLKNVGPGRRDCWRRSRGSRCRRHPVRRARQPLHRAEPAEHDCSAVARRCAHDDRDRGRGPRCAGVPRSGLDRAAGRRCT